jgi:polysaccharide deacetylase family protein (PEP-CTERM system associated)
LKKTDSLVALTVDAEEWFHVPGREEYASPARWTELPASFPRALEGTLQLLEECGWRATFFVLGWLARKYPVEVRRIAAQGHEVACHSMEHGLVSRMSPARFAEDVASAKGALEEVTGQRVMGFRAPCWSMPREHWPYEALGEQGFTYSSSRLAIAGLGGGRPRAEKLAGVMEYPALSAWRWPLAWPAGGTVALRTAPVTLLARAREGASGEGRPAVYWFHPWELDAAAPRVGGSPLFRWSRYARLERLPERLRLLVPTGDRTLGRIAEPMDVGPHHGHTES